MSEPWGIAIRIASVSRTKEETKLWYLEIVPKVAGDNHIQSPWAYHLWMQIDRGIDR
jgi:hypothetical protein